MLGSGDVGVDATQYRPPIPCQESPPSTLAFSEDVQSFVNVGHLIPSAPTSHCWTVSEGRRTPPPSTVSPTSFQLAAQHPSHALPDPSTSALGRDAILAYAYGLYQTQEPESSSVLAATPVYNPARPSTASENIDISQLLPLLTLLRSSHPNHLPTLLLLSSVQFAMGGYDASLDINKHILSIDPDYVSQSPFTMAILIKCYLGGSDVQYRCNK